MAKATTRRTIWFIAGGSAMLFALGLAGPAVAGTGRTVDDQHCVVDLSSESGTVTCYATFTEALADATGGRITDAPAEAIVDAELDARIEAVGDEVETAPTDENGEFAAPHPQYVLSIEYKARDFGGTAWIYNGNKPCTEASYSKDYVGDDRNDSISSFRTYSECGVKHFEHANFEGASTPFETTKDYIGDAMNDQTSSIKWQRA